MVSESAGGAIVPGSRACAGASSACETRITRLRTNPCAIPAPSSAPPKNWDDVGARGHARSEAESAQCPGAATRAQTRAEARTKTRAAARTEEGSRALRLYLRRARRIRGGFRAAIPVQRSNHRGAGPGRLRDSGCAAGAMALQNDWTMGAGTADRACLAQSTTGHHPAGAGCPRRLWPGRRRVQVAGRREHSGRHDRSFADSGFASG